MLDLIRPEGSLLLTTNDSPIEVGNWEKIASGLLLVNCSDAMQIGFPVGERQNKLVTHTHVLSNHSHGNVYMHNGINASNGLDMGSRSNGTGTGYTIRTSATSIDLDPSGAEDNDINLAPYKVVNIYKRLEGIADINTRSILELFNIVFPVGTILYHDSVVFDFSDIDGGIEFNDFGKRRVLIGLGENDESFCILGQEGGYENQFTPSHTHGSSHRHDVTWGSGGWNYGDYWCYRRDGAAANVSYATGNTTAVGEQNTPYDNYQPYIALYCKERIA